MKNSNDDTQKPIYKTNTVGSWIKIYSDKVVFNESLKMFGFLGSTTVPLNQIASVKTNLLLNKITLETTGGKHYDIVTHKKKEVQKAIYDAQAKLGTSQDNFSVADEIVKLNDLQEKGVISKKEFEKKKKQLLNS